MSALVESAEIAELQKYTPDFEYDLRDLSLSGGEEIKGQAKLRTGLELLRYIFSEDLGRKLPEIFRNLREMDQADAIEYSRSLLAYLSGAGRRVRKEEVKEAMQEVFAKKEFDKSALFIQEWVEEGVAIGREEGREEGVVIGREEGREEGIQIGEHKGLSSLTLRQIRRRLGEIDDVTQELIRALPNDRLEELGEALLDFTSFDDLRKWLSDDQSG